MLYICKSMSDITFDPPMPCKNGMYVSQAWIVDVIKLYMPHLRIGSMKIISIIRDFHKEMFKYMLESNYVLKLANGLGNIFIAQELIRRSKTRKILMNEEGRLKYKIVPNELMKPVIRMYWDKKKCTIYNKTIFIFKSGDATRKAQGRYVETQNTDEKKKEFKTHILK